MAKQGCSHRDGIVTVKPSARGCEECLKTGTQWVHLRLCRTCGHFHSTHHPIIEGYDPPEGWAWCYVDEIFFDLGEDVTPQDGPIPRYV